MSSTPLLPQSTRLPHRYALPIILVSEGLEELAYYGLVGNLVLYLQQNHINWSETRAYIAAAVTTGLKFIIGVITGWLSDTLGRRSYHIIAGYLIYLVGLAIMTSLGYKTRQQQPTADSPSPEDLTYLIWSGLLLSAVGAGTVRINMAPFGGDQARPEGVAKAVRFFNHLYCAINLGCVVGFSGLVILQDYDYFIGFLVMFVLVLISMLLFCFGRYYNFFIERKSGTEMFSMVNSILTNAREVRRARSNLEQPDDSKLIDYAKLDQGGKFPAHQVEDVKNLGRACLALTLLFPYWICYGLMTNTLFLLQANMTLSTIHCNNQSDCSSCGIRNANASQHANRISIPPLLECSAVASIVIGVPLALALYNWLRRRGVTLTTRRRVVAGLCLATLSLLLATVLEVLRLERVSLSLCDPSVPSISRNWVFWMIPQYCLKGLSEVFAVIAGLEYAYIMAPQVMQGFVIGLFFMFYGLGYFAGAVLYFFMKTTFPCVYFANSLRNLYAACCAGLGMWTLIFCLLTHFFPLGLKNVTVFGDVGSIDRPLPDNVNR